MKICLVKTRAKPVTKTFHGDFTVNFPESARISFLRKSGPVDFARGTDFVHFLCVSRQLCTYMKTTVRPIGSLYFPDVTLKNNLENTANKTEKLSSKEIPSRRPSETPSFKQVGKLK